MTGAVGERPDQGTLTAIDSTCRAMPDITFHLADGSEIGFEAPEGVTLMQAATGYGVDGILAECGGAASCGTCHVYVDPAWAARLPAPSEREDETLGFTAAERRPTSRLACQVRLTPDLQGLCVTVPAEQR